MKLTDKFINSAIIIAKRIMFTLLIYTVLIAAIFFYAGIFMIKMWLLPVAAIVFTIMSAYAAYEDRYVFKSYIEDFNNRLAALVTWYIELGVQ